MPNLSKLKNNRYWRVGGPATTNTSAPYVPSFLRTVGLLTSISEQTSSATFTSKKPRASSRKVLANYRWRSDQLVSGTLALADWYVHYLTMTAHNDIELLRRKVKGFAHFRKNWDTHGARPICQTAITDALRLLDLLEKRRIVPNAAIPTSDESILIRYEFGSKTFKWEFSGDGEIAYVRTEPDGNREYIDVPADFSELPA
jgi:hypothetical protein